jgi:hypothetical protein
MISVPEVPLKAQLAIVYDLRDPCAWDAARRHRRMWGMTYTDIHHLDADHLVLALRPATDERWRAWEHARLELIRKELAA